MNRHWEGGGGGSAIPMFPGVLHEQISKFLLKRMREGRGGGFGMRPHVP